MLDGTPMSDGHAKVKWSSPIFKIPRWLDMPKFDSPDAVAKVRWCELHQSLMVLDRHSTNIVLFIHHSSVNCM